MNTGQKIQKSLCRLAVVTMVLSSLCLAGMTHMYWGMSARYETQRKANILLRNELSEGQNCKPPLRRA